MLEQIERANNWAELALAEAVKANEQLADIAKVLRRIEKGGREPSPLQKL